MPEIICVASRFASLELAGQAYSPIWDLLRAHQNTDLSVYRFESGGAAHVAVVGLAPETSVMAAINQVLGLGEPAALADEIINVLFQGRGAYSTTLFSPRAWRAGTPAGRMISGRSTATTRRRPGTPGPGRVPWRQRPEPL